MHWLPTQCHSWVGSRPLCPLCSRAPVELGLGSVLGLWSGVGLGLWSGLGLGAVTIRTSDPAVTAALGYSRPESSRTHVIHSGSV